MRLIDADRLKQDHYMSDECETCINDVGRCQNWHVYTKMDFCGWIDDAPTVDPVKHGHWIKDRLESLNGGTYGVYRCSKCKWFSEDVGYFFNYCPCCGAKMDEVENVREPN